MKQAPGPATRIDMAGVFFSLAAPSPVPVTIEPHLMALIYCQATDPGSGVFEVIFRDGFDEDSEQLARNVSPFTVEPGKFTYCFLRSPKSNYSRRREYFASPLPGIGPRNRCDRPRLGHGCSAEGKKWTSGNRNGSRSPCTRVVFTNHATLTTRSTLEKQRSFYSVCWSCIDLAICNVVSQRLRSRTF